MEKKTILDRLDRRRRGVCKRGSGHFGREATHQSPPALTRRTPTKRTTLRLRGGRRTPLVAYAPSLSWAPPGQDPIAACGLADILKARGDLDGAER